MLHAILRQPYSSPSSAGSPVFLAEEHPSWACWLFTSPLKRRDLERQQVLSCVSSCSLPTTVCICSLTAHAGGEWWGWEIQTWEDWGRGSIYMTVGNPSSSLGKDFLVRPFWTGCIHILVSNLSPLLLLEGNPLNSLVPRVNL